MSREAELYKDKIEVSLDGRQIFYLFFGGSVIVGLVFVLGVMVGRRVEARGHSDRARVSATVDPLAALDRLEGGNGLSFQGALRGVDEPESDVEKTIAALPKPDGAGDKHAAAKKAEPAAKPEAKADDEHAAPAKADAKPEAKADAKPEAKAEPAKADKKTEPAKADAKAVDHKSEAAKSDSKAAPAEKKTEKPKFTLQLSSFQDKAEALAYFDAMKSAGYQPYMTEGAVDGKQYFRVRIGSYQTIEAANEARSELQKTANRSSIVIKL